TPRQQELLPLVAPLDDEPGFLVTGRAARLEDALQGPLSEPADGEFFHRLPGRLQAIALRALAFEGDVSHALGAALVLDPQRLAARAARAKSLEGEGPRREEGIALWLPSRRIPLAAAAPDHARQQGAKCERTNSGSHSRRHTR